MFIPFKVIAPYESIFKSILNSGTKVTPLVNGHVLMIKNSTFYLIEIFLLIQRNLFQNIILYKLHI